MTSFYFCVLLFFVLVAYAGIEETMRLVTYADLQFRYACVRVQMKWMGWKLKRQLVKDVSNFEKFLEEYYTEDEVE